MTNRLPNQILFLCHDLKYMARPSVMPTLIQQTDFLDCLIRGLTHFQFIDAVECPTEMQPYDNWTQVMMTRSTVANMVVKRL